MSTNFNFKSQICTDRVQSERLLALGLKKETADMYMAPSWGGGKIIGYYAPDVIVLDDHFDVFPNDLPAWSLHRLLKIVQPMMENQNEVTIPFDNIFEQIIECIEQLIKEGYFPKEYLEE